jgi:type VI secretion system protein
VYLKITVLKYLGRAISESKSAVFDQEGGTVGRSAENRLVLPDDSISRKHAEISYENGRYYLTDDSANGTLIWNCDLLVHHGKVELADGDILRIGDYELSVGFTEEAHIDADIPVTPAGGVSSFFEIEEGLNKKKNADTDGPVAPQEETRIPEHSAAELPDDIDAFFKTEAEEIGIPVPEPAWGPLDFSPQEPQVSDTSRTQPELTIIERRKDVREVQPSPPAPDSSEEPRQTTQKAYRELFDLFLKGARIDDPKFVDNAEIPEVMENLGAVFREMVNGLWTVLRGRTELKAEIRLAMTMVRSAGNNPLKLSPRIEDVLKSLLKREHPSFLEPIAAVREGFGDVMNHQLAMNAGIQAALLEALEQFDPQRFVEEHKEKSPFQTKGKHWREYCDAYPELKERASEGIFGKAFVRAYEEQLEKLRSRHKKL